MVPRGLLITWDVVTDGSNSCARSFIIHNITVVREADGIIIVTVDDIVDTQIKITDSSLEPRQNYSIHVGTRLLQGTCKTGEAASIVCKMSDDLPPTTTPPGKCSQNIIIFVYVPCLNLRPLIVCCNVDPPASTGKFGGGGGGGGR